MTLEELAVAVSGSDLVVSCTGAVRPVLTLADVHHALAAAQRDEDAEPLVLCDLGMPRDIDPPSPVAGVAVVDMDRVQREPSARAAAADAEAARRIVAAEVAAYLACQRQAEVTDRHRAASACRRGGPGRVAEAGQSAARPRRRPPSGGRPHRAPGGRQAPARPHGAGQTAGLAPGADSYAEALRELFELDPQAVDAVAASEIALPTTESDA